MPARWIIVGGELEIIVSCALQIMAGLNLQLAGDFWNVAEAIYTLIEEVVPAKATSRDIQ